MVLRGYDGNDGLGVREADAVVVRLDPSLLHPEDLHAPDAGQQHGSDRSVSAWVFGFRQGMLMVPARVDRTKSVTPLTEGPRLADPAPLLAEAEEGIEAL